MKTAKLLKITALVLLITLIFIILGSVFAVFLITKDVNLQKYDLEATAQDIKMYDDSGLEIAYPEKYKIECAYEDISPYIVNAFVALEDKRFFSHRGLDYRRIVKAVINNIKAGYFKEGGSTITQQLAKNAILTNEKSLIRKLKEAKLAVQIEKRYSKEQILEMYLNTIYFGHSLYGVNAACKRLFLKSPDSVTLSEAAILAGIVKNPKRNSPLNNVENALERRNLVLRLMSEQGYINESEMENALNEGYTAPEEPNAETDLSYSAAAIKEAAEKLGISEKQLITGGYSVYTYMDRSLQRAASQLISNPAYDAENADRLILAADNISGGIKAYSSTMSLDPNEFRRQPASAIKPVIAYAPAFESGKFSPATPLLDEPTVFDGYAPDNYKNSYLGWINVEKAAMSSSNVCALKLVSETGLDYCMNIASKTGLTFDSRDSLAAALGGMTYGVTPAEISEAYMCLASGGVHKNAVFVKRIEKNGVTVYRNITSETRVLSRESAYLVTDILKSTAKSGTAKKLAAVKGEIAAKTGTNGDKNGNSDAWCMSYNAAVTVCAWYGARGGKSMPLSVTGGGLPALISAKIYSAEPLSEGSVFEVPGGIIYADIDEYSYSANHSLLLAGVNTPYEYRKSAIFSEKHLPGVSDYFDKPLPDDFEVFYGDGEVVISFTASDRFVYRLTDLTGAEIMRIPPDSGKKEISLYEYGFGIYGYRIEAVTEDGVSVATSPPKLAFIYSL